MLERIELHNPGPPTGTVILAFTWHQHTAAPAAASGALGHITTLRTDTADLAESVLPFTTFAELARLCVHPLAHHTLSRIVIHHGEGTERGLLTLGFLAARNA